MKFAALNPKLFESKDGKDARLREQMSQLYGLFDLDVNTGTPSEIWMNRNLKNVRFPFPLQSHLFPDFWYRRIQVNKRAGEALLRVYNDFHVLYTVEAMHQNGLDQFVRCYQFGAGRPTLFWYGGGWELSKKVDGEVLAEATRIFLKHGWKFCGLEDKSRWREFEFW
jgi:hypothetical protein